jgi:hypothetical protein
MGADGGREARAHVLADEMNRRIVSLLGETAGPLRVEALAARLVDGDVDVAPAEEYEQRVQQLVVDLHHGRLPRLADVDLVEYDPTRSVVERPASATSRVDWTPEALTDAVIDHLGTPAANDDTTAVIEGRDGVIQAGRRLVENAEAELFFIYVSTALLQEECIACCERAIDRDVEIFLGSPATEVRELGRARLPDATIWEPQRDWWGKQAPRRVGRLVLADRQRVMLGILDRTDGSHEPVETAIVGHGRSHPIVVLVRDLLGPRLDHLDFQSDAFSDELPT